MSTPGPASSDAYDVIVAGASFAGLAASRALRARVLLLDPKPIGDGVTSACAAPVRTVAFMGAEAAIQEIHTHLVIHTPGGSVEWPLPEPFCTFDYRRLCQDAAAGAGVEFRLATAQGHDGRRVFTSVGSFEGRILVDATGPRAALAGHGRPRYVAFGVESEVPRQVPPGLHFYFVPEIRDGYAWAFPCGTGTRFGVLSYRGRSKLMPALNAFMARFGTRPDGVHGGFLATGWARKSSGQVFVVGDAAGHCLPISGEGIRTAVQAGAHCGALVQQLLDGTLSPDDAHRAYRAFVAADRRRYRGLLAGNLLVLGLPQRWLGMAAVGMARPAVLRWFFGHYFGIFEHRTSPDQGTPEQITLRSWDAP